MMIQQIVSSMIAEVTISWPTGGARDELPAPHGC
jgi:hypothetical protein